jgi:hypothetical protein
MSTTPVLTGRLVLLLQSNRKTRPEFRERVLIYFRGGWGDYQPTTTLGPQ